MLGAALLRSDCCSSQSLATRLACLAAPCLLLSLSRSSTLFDFLAASRNAGAFRTRWPNPPQYRYTTRPKKIFGRQCSKPQRCCSYTRKASSHYIHIWQSIGDQSSINAIIGKQRPNQCCVFRGRVSTLLVVAVLRGCCVGRRSFDLP